jgi:cob(I)alamin adenosyltransferase
MSGSGNNAVTISHAQPINVFINKIQYFNDSMKHEQILERIAEDVSFIKAEIIVIKNEVEELKKEEIKPEYLKKLKNMERKGRFHQFKSIDDLKKVVEDVQN